MFTLEISFVTMLLACFIAWMMAFLVYWSFTRVKGSKYKKAIFLIGSVGAGKSTIRVELVRQLKSMGYIVVVVNMDYLSKFGQQKQANEIFKTEIEHGEKLSQNQNKPIVLIIDMCNERLRTPTFDLFGMRISDNYECVTFMPNFFSDDVKGYQAWTIWNVIGRSLPMTVYDHWYLTKDGSSLKTCIRVANNKLTTMLSTNRLPLVEQLDETMDETSLRELIKPHVVRYVGKVAAQGSIEEIASRFIKEKLCRN